jgi:hypothetical protein
MTAQMNTLDTIAYLRKLWIVVFPNRGEVGDHQVMIWLDTFGDAEIEVVWKKAARRFRTEQVDDIGLYKYISGTLKNRRNERAAAVQSAEKPPSIQASAA